MMENNIGDVSNTALAKANKSTTIQEITVSGAVPHQAAGEALRHQ